MLFLIIAYDISELEYIKLVLPFKEGINWKGIFVLYLQFFTTRNYIFFKISAWSLFLKYSKDFANFSLDILIKYILIEKKECTLLIVGEPSRQDFRITRYINYAYIHCLKKTKDRTILSLWGFQLLFFWRSRCRPRHWILKSLLTDETQPTIFAKKKGNYTYTSFNMNLLTFCYRLNKHKIKRGRKTF